jgi:hypothetical protein
MSSKKANLFVGFSTQTKSSVAKEEKKEDGDPATESDLTVSGLAYTQGLNRYVHSFSEVCIIDPQAADPSNPGVPIFKAVTFRHSSSGDKAPVAVRVRSYIYKHLCVGPVLLVGFNAVEFMSLLNTECALPPASKPLPSSLLPSLHLVDVANLVFSGLDPDTKVSDILAMYTSSVSEDAKKWTALTRDWAGPGKDPARDAKISTELAVRWGVTQ